MFSIYLRLYVNWKYYIIDRSIYINKRLFFTIQTSSLFKEDLLTTLV